MTRLWSRTISEIPIVHDSFVFPDPLQETMVDIRDYAILQNMFIMNSAYHFPANRVSKHFFGELCCLVAMARAEGTSGSSPGPTEFIIALFGAFKFKLFEFENPRQHSCHSLVA